VRSVSIKKMGDFGESFLADYKASEVDYWHKHRWDWCFSKIGFVLWVELILLFVGFIITLGGYGPSLENTGVAGPVLLGVCFGLILIYGAFRYIYRPATPGKRERTAEKWYCLPASIVGMGVMLLVVGAALGLMLTIGRYVPSAFQSVAVLGPVLMAHSLTVLLAAVFMRFDGVRKEVCGCLKIGGEVGARQAAKEEELVAGAEVAMNF